MQFTLINFLKAKSSYTSKSKAKRSMKFFGPNAAVLLRRSGGFSSIDGLVAWFDRESSQFMCLLLLYLSVTFSWRMFNV